MVKGIVKVTIERQFVVVVLTDSRKLAILALLRLVSLVQLSHPNWLRTQSQPMLS
jgi:hypothetical protein